MHRTINKNETLALLSGVSVVIVLLIPMFYPIPLLAKLVTVLVAAYVVYLTLRLVWIMAEPTDASVSLKPRASTAQLRGLCPICGKNQRGHKTLTVGYRKPTQMALHLGGIDPLMLGEGLVDDVHLFVQICERCARRIGYISKLGFLAPVGLDRSFRVLRRKPGYLRGLRHPFELSNIKTAN
ncbi:MAG: hypothetical protein WAO19_13580 [Candidatus Kryptoniota bacterium]